MTDILSRIDDTLTFHSAGLGVDLEVPVEQNALDLPDVDLDSAEDWRAAQPNRPHGLAGERVSYYDLSRDEREAVHSWVREHGLDPNTTPAGTPWDFDDAAGEWRIPQYPQRNGRPYLTLSGDIAMVTVRRMPKRPLPWRTG